MLYAPTGQFLIYSKTDFAYMPFSLLIVGTSLITIIL